MYFIDLVGFFPFLSQKEIYTSFFFTFIPKFRKLESNIFTDRKESFHQINIIFLSSPFFLYYFNLYRRFKPPRFTLDLLAI